MSPVATRPRSAISSWIRSDEFRFPLSLFVLLRAGYMTFSYMGLWIQNGLLYHDSARHKELQPYKSIDGLCRWDCGWFDIVAREGYSKLENAKVFPLFPLLGRLLHDYAGVNRFVAFVALSNLASLISYWVIYTTFVELSNRDSARWGLLLFTAYPFHYYQAAGYPESTMVLMSALAIHLMMKRRPLWSGHALGIGIMARHLTVFGGAGMLAAHVRQSWPSPKKFFLSWGFVGLCLPFAYVGAFSYYLKIVNGDPLAFYHSREIGWGSAVWYSVFDIWKHETMQRNPEYFFYQAFMVIPFLGTIGLFFRKKWLEMAIASAVLMAVVAGSGGVAIGRYSASCWPAYLALGVWMTRHKTLQAPIYGSLMLLQGLFFYLFTHQWRVL